LQIPVTFTLSTIGVTPQSVNIAYTLGGAAPSGPQLTLSGQAGGYTAAFVPGSGGIWLGVSPSTGTLPTDSVVSLFPNPSVMQALAAGTYTGNVVITPASGPAVSILVTLVVSPQPPATVTPSTVNLNYQINGQNNVGAQQNVTLATTASQALNFSFGSPSVTPNPAGRNWITVAPTSGTIPANGSVQSAIGYDSTANLPAGNYSGTIPLSVPGASLATSNVTVNLLVSNSPLLSLSSSALTFNYEIGGIEPPAQNLTPLSSAVAASSTTGQMPVAVSFTTANGGNWLSVTPSSLNTGSPITVSVNPAGLLPGTYTGTIAVTPGSGAGAGNGAQTATVTLVVANDPSIQASVSSLQFPYQTGQSAPAAQTVNVSSSTGAPLNYSVTTTENSNCGSVNWLAVSGATTGTTNNAFTVSVQNLAGLTPGINCAGNVAIAATNPSTGAAALGSPWVIPVTLYVSGNPLLVTTPTSLSFTSAPGGAAQSANITLNSTSASSTIPYSVTFATTNGGSTWLSAAPLSGSTSSGSNLVAVSVNPGLLSAGTYNGTVTITASGSGVADSPIGIPVTLQVTSGTLSVSSATVNLSYTAGATSPATQAVQVTSAGSPLNFTAAANSGSLNWLSVTPASGTTPGTLTISGDGSRLSPGTYSGTVTVSSPGAAGSPSVIQVNLTVNSGTISASPAPSAGLAFYQAAGGSAPAPQNITVTTAPAGIAFTAAANTSTGGNWLLVSTSGNTVQVSANAGSLAVGTYQGTVTITANGATGSPITYNVTLNVTPLITINASPSKLNFSYVLNTTAPAAQTVQITATAPAGIGTLAIFPYAATVHTSDGANWLAVTPATGNVPGSASVSVNPAGLAVGNYTGTITIASGSAQTVATPAAITVKLSVAATPAPVIAAVSNAASGATGAISPGEEVAIYGSNFGPSSVVYAQPDSSGVFPPTLSNTQVLFDGAPAPIIAIAAGQVDVMVPYGLSGRPTTTVQVTYFGVSSAAVIYNVAAAAPGIYTLNQSGTGNGAIINQANTVNGPNAPAPAGSIVAVYMTGEGVTTPASTTGLVAPVNGTGLNTPVLNVTATVGGKQAKVWYAGSAPGIVYGVSQVNVEIPAGLSSGAQPIAITLTGANGQTFTTQSGVTVSVQ
jgi:uncharacterized protein (TIGR03437 family)